MLAALRYTRLSVIRSLIILAVFVRAWIPAGFMPDMQASAAGKLFPMVICSGITGSTTTIYLPASEIPDLAASETPPPKKPENHDASSHALCIYSVALASAMSANLPQLAVPVFETASFTAEGARLVTATASKPYLSQGPPAFSLHA